MCSNGGMCKVRCRPLATSEVLTLSELKAPMTQHIAAQLLQQMVW